MSRTNIFSSFRDIGYMQRQVDFFERAHLVVEGMRADAVTPADLLAVAEVFDTVERWRRQAIAQLGRLVAAERLAGAGRSPAVEGHGCPALAPAQLASAVGPAPMPCPHATVDAVKERLDITILGNPLFCGLAVQELPGVNHPDNLGSEGEENPCA